MYLYSLVIPICNCIRKSGYVSSWLTPLLYRGCFICLWNITLCFRFMNEYFIFFHFEMNLCLKSWVQNLQFVLSRVLIKLILFYNVCNRNIISWLFLRNSKGSRKNLVMLLISHGWFTSPVSCGGQGRVSGQAEEEDDGGGGAKLLKGYQDSWFAHNPVDQ